MRPPRTKNVKQYSANDVLTIVSVSFPVIFMFMAIVLFCFKDGESIKEHRHSNAMEYYGKSIILDKDTLEIIDYHMYNRKFMLSDRTWISEAVVFRLAR